MVQPDIFNKVNLGSVTSDTNGEAEYVARLSRKSVFVGVQAASGASVSIEASYNGSEWYNLDTKDYASGTSQHSDIFAYNEFFPYVRTTCECSGTTVNTVITGRGV